MSKILVKKFGKAVEDLDEQMAKWISEFHLPDKDPNVQLGEAFNLFTAIRVLGRKIKEEKEEWIHPLDRKGD